MKEPPVEEQSFRASGAAGVPVREAPLAQILSDGRRKRRRRNGLTGAALALVAVVAVACNWPGGGAEEMDRRSTEAYLEDTPGIPLVLPQTLPIGYVWNGPRGSQGDQSGNVIQRDSMFVPAGALADASRVTVCLAKQGPPLCPQGDQRINRTLDGMQVVIAFSGPPAPTPEALEYWETVPLVTDLSVAWLK